MMSTQIKWQIELWIVCIQTKLRRRNVAEFAGLLVKPAIVYNRIFATSTQSIYFFCIFLVPIVIFEINSGIQLDYLHSHVHLCKCFPSHCLFIVLNVMNDLVDQKSGRPVQEVNVDVQESQAKRLLLVFFLQPWKTGTIQKKFEALAQKTFT